LEKNLLEMKFRRHHNNKGYRQIKRGKTATQLLSICRKLKLLKQYYKGTKTSRKRKNGGKKYEF